MVLRHLELPAPIAKISEEIRKANPAKQAIPYIIDTWRRQLLHRWEFEAVFMNFPEHVTRADLFQLARRAGESSRLDDLRVLFAATMTWGYGTTGYGPWRTGKMLASSAYPAVLGRSYQLICAGRLGQAHQEFSLDRCGAPYFTKFFYFLSKGIGIKEYALILDSRVYRALAKLQIDVGRYASKSAWTAEGYLNYVTDLHQWANALRVEADQIELALFQNAVGSDAE